MLLEFEKELKKIGLCVNEAKTTILVRDPLQLLPTFEETIRINGKNLKIVTIMKYLGIYISSDLDRRSTVANRIKMAYKNLHMFTPFFINNRLSFATLMRLYHTVLIPAATYGLKVATLTKLNRQSLTHMENYIVLKLRNVARDPPQTENIMQLLQGRTIDRKCRVLRLKYWGHIMRRPTDHVLRKALRYSIPGKRKIGRPCFTWHDSLNRALRRSNVTDWQDTIQDTQAHNRKCESSYLPSHSDDSD